MLGTGAKRFDFHQSKPHHGANRNDDRYRRPQGGVVKAIQVTFPRYHAPYSARLCCPNPPGTFSPYPWLRRLAARRPRPPGDPNMRQISWQPAVRSCARRRTAMPRSCRPMTCCLPSRHVFRVPTMRRKEAFGQRGLGIPHPQNDNRGKAHVHQRGRIFWITSRLHRP
jgi:hypothetical protein